MVELLVVIAIIAVLVSRLLPALARAKERAKVVKVHAELYGVGLALEMYADDHAGELPPVRVNCNSDLYAHWCQFPPELADQGYLPKSDRPGMAAYMEDVFNPGHTYKYATPGPQILNDTPGGGQGMSCGIHSKRFLQGKRSTVLPVVNRVKRNAPGSACNWSTQAASR